MTMIQKSGSKFALPSLIGLLAFGISPVLAQSPNPHAVEEPKTADATKATTSAIATMLANFNTAKAIMTTPIVIPAPIVVVIIVPLLRYVLSEQHIS